MPPTVCRSCGAALALAPPIARDAECPGCGHDVRACVNCRHYDPRMHNACRETEADPVEDRQRRNFCEYFELSRDPWKAPATGRAQDARTKLEGLFGGKPQGPAAGATARERLEGLFKKKPDAGG